MATHGRQLPVASASSNFTEPPASSVQSVVRSRYFAACALALVISITWRTVSPGFAFSSKRGGETSAAKPCANAPPQANAHAAAASASAGLVDVDLEIELEALRGNEAAAVGRDAKRNGVLEETGADGTRVYERSPPGDERTGKEAPLSGPL